MKKYKNSCVQMRQTYHLHWWSHAKYSALIFILLHSWTWRPMRAPALRLTWLLIVSFCLDVFPRQHFSSFSVSSFFFTLFDQTNKTRYLNILILDMYFFVHRLFFRFKFSQLYFFFSFVFASTCCWLWNMLWYSITSFHLKMHSSFSSASCRFHSRLTYFLQ